MHFFVKFLQNRLLNLIFGVFLGEITKIPAALTRGRDGNIIWCVFSIHVVALICINCLSINQKRQTKTLKTPSNNQKLRFLRSLLLKIPYKYIYSNFHHQISPLTGQLFEGKNQKNIFLLWSTIYNNFKQSSFLWLVKKGQKWSKNSLFSKKWGRGASQQRVPSQNTKPYEITFRRLG